MFRSFNVYITLCTMFTAVSSILLGYDIGVMSGALLFVSQDLKMGILQQEMVVGSLNLISIVGGVMAGYLSDAIGRKKTMAIAATIFFVGAIVMALARSFAVLFSGRLIAGIGVGFALQIAPVFSAELSPARYRGFIVSITEVSINLGILLGYLISFALQGLPLDLGWRLMLGAGCLPALVLGLGTLAMPESPRWLVARRRLPEARHILRRTFNGDEGETRDRLRDIMEAVGFINPDSLVDPSAADYDVAFARHRKKEQNAWQKLLFPKDPTVRRMLICAVGMHAFQQASGVDAVVYYSPIVFGEAGVRSRIGKLGATVGVGFTKFIFIFVATALLDRFGRKPLLLASATGVTLCLLTVGTAFIRLGINSTQGDTLVSVNTNTHAASPSKVGAGITIFAICAYVASFSIGLGPVSWVFASEVFPLQLRAQAVGMCVFANRLVSGTIALTFLSISKAITPAGVFFLYGGITFAGFLFFLFMIPETKGKTLEEMFRFFEGLAGVEPKATTASDQREIENVR